MIDDTVTKTINADRTALFLVDSEGNNLYAQVFTVSKDEEVLVTLDNLETTRFEDYLNQLGRKLNVVCYKGSNVAYVTFSLIAITSHWLINLLSLILGFPLIKVWWAIQLELGSYVTLLIHGSVPTIVLRSMK